MTSIRNHFARISITCSLLGIGLLINPCPGLGQSVTPDSTSRPIYTPVGASLQVPDALRPIVRNKPALSQRAEYEFPRETYNQVSRSAIAPPLSSFSSNPTTLIATPYPEEIDFNRSAQDPEQLPPALNENRDTAQTTGDDVVQQLFPDGKIRIRRHVAQDENGNFYNHGLWEAFDRNGQVVAKGDYDKGLMDGQWMRKHDANADGLFKTKPFSLYQGPFYSVAQFSQGKMNGVWKIFDPFQRSIFEIPYRDGQRHGTATWWYPNAAKMRVVHFNDGLIDGEIVEWDDKDQPAGREDYDQGRKIVRTTSLYRPGQKESEDYFLDAKLVPEGQDDWWNAQPTSYLPQGRRIQNGSSMAWFSNNQTRKKGQFKDGRQIGQFTWWHQNGNVKTQGMYADGKKNERWTWWHDNGMKQFEGDYEDDIPVGLWRSWDAVGKVLKQEDFSAESESQSIMSQMPDPPTTSPHVDPARALKPDSPETNPNDDSATAEDSDFTVDLSQEKLPSPPPATDDSQTEEDQVPAEAPAGKDPKKTDNLEGISPLTLNGPEKPASKNQETNQKPDPKVSQKKN